MSQTTMDTVLHEATAPSELARLERERLAALRWEHWGRDIGTLTLEQIQQANHPDWQWGDYEI